METAISFDPVTLSWEVHVALDHAALALGRLDAWSSRQPNAEAVASTTANADESDGACIAALDWGLLQVRNGFPLSARLLRGVHSRLLNAPLVPLDASAVEGMEALERWLNDVPRRTPPLTKAAVALVHLATLHPFPSGNRRLGRLLVPLMFCADGVLRDPLWYLSRSLRRRHTEFDQLVAAVRETGDWTPWLIGFAREVAETATDAIATTDALEQLAASNRERIRAAGRPTTSTLAVFDALCARPIDKAPLLAARTGLTLPTVNAALERLQTLGIVDEITGKRRNRTYQYSAYILRLGEGTEPL